MVLEPSQPQRGLYLQDYLWEGMGMAWWLSVCSDLEGALESNIQQLQMLVIFKPLYGC